MPVDIVLVERERPSGLLMGILFRVCPCPFRMERDSGKDIVLLKESERIS